MLKLDGKKVSPNEFAKLLIQEKLNSFDDCNGDLDQDVLTEEDYSIICSAVTKQFNRIEKFLGAEKIKNRVAKRVLHKQQNDKESDEAFEYYGNNQ